MAAGVRTMHTELEIINEAREAPVIDRKLSGSPEPIDTRAIAESAQIPGQRSQSPGITSPASRKGTGDGMPAAADFDDEVTRQDSGGAYHTFIQRFHRKNTGESSPTFQAPRRQSTTITNASLPFKETEAWDKKTVLALDGGGIRGYSELLIIKALMEKIATLESTHSDPAQTSFHPLSPLPSITPSNSSAESDQTQAEPSQWLPCHYFDYMAGTSTGGLIAIMLGRLRMNVDDCITDYEELGEKVFGHPRWFHLRSPLFWPRDKYNHETLQNVVNSVVKKRVPRVATFPGGTNFAYDENRCRTVVVAYQQREDQGVEKPYLFRTYKNLHKIEKGSKDKCFERNFDLAHDIPIWEVARATSAAPSYFEPAKIDGLAYLDGGFGANNPGQEIDREVRRMNNNSVNAIGILISIGTGLDDDAGRIIDKIGLPRYLNYLKFMKKCATDAEKTHEYLLDLTKYRTSYHRLNVEKGIGCMKLDEWKTRGKLRRKVGAAIGRLRKSQGKAQEQPRQEQERTEGMDSSSSLASDDSRIPEWFQPRNKTLQHIREKTEAYLSEDEIQAELQKCAEYLVKNRRARVESDRQRWERACYSTWYQCNRDQCPRGEKEYRNIEEIRAHFLDKHRDAFKKNMDPDVLHRAIDSCKVHVH